jgi:CBS domain-containing protein
MSKSTIILLVFLGAFLVVVSLMMRVLSGGKYEFKTIDLVFLVIPLVVVALVTGKLKGVDIFGVKADLSALWTAAAQTEIEKQVAPTTAATVQDVVQAVEMASKGGTDELQRLLKTKVEALEFKLGHGGYYGPAIQKYFEALSGSPSLRVVVIDNPDGTLFGMYDAADLVGYLRVAGEPGYEQFQRLLNQGGETERAELAKLPGFVSADNAVTTTMSKRDALTRMEQLNADILPVVDEQKHFVGTVKRAKLIASLILLITDKLENQ